MYFITIGFLLFLSVSLRPNYLPSAILLILICLFISVIYKKNFLNTSFVIIGFLPFFLMLIHNYYYGGEIVLMTSAAHHNTHAPINLWFNFFKDIFTLNFIDHPQISKQVIRWIRPYEIHYFLIFIILLFSFCYKRNRNIIIISLIALSQHLVLLIYEPAGRYSYLAWILSILVLFYYISLFSGFFYNLQIKKLIKIK